MVNPNRFYTYAYLREDRTPYYIGKGKDDRAYKKGKGEVNPPKDTSRVIYLKQNLTEEEAFKHEIYMIDVFGRIDLGTGILRNKTDGGEGLSGWVPSEEFRKKVSEVSKNRSEETRRKLSEAVKGEKNYFSGKRFCGKNSPNYGKHRSNEHKEKLSKLHNRLFEFTKPNGEKIVVETNLKKFCEENNLNRVMMCRILHNKKYFKSHRGWTVKLLSP